MYSLMTFGIPVDRLPTSTDCLGLKAGRHVKFLNVLRNLEETFPLFQSESGCTNISDDEDNDDGGPLQPIPLPLQQQHRHHHQQQHPKLTLVVVPSQHDVLFGRGKPIQLHPGNVWLGSIVEDLVPIYYQETSRDGKTAVAQHVVQLIKSRGGRFLRPYNSSTDGGGKGGGGSGGTSNSSGGCIWVEVNDEKGQEKVCTAFRSCRATQKHKKNQHHDSSSTSTTAMKNCTVQQLLQQQQQRLTAASKRPRTYT